MFRLYNQWSGEHFYTASPSERNGLIQAGWNYEGIGWFAPKDSNTPVYRLYNQWAGDHHYTTSFSERDHLISVGWTYEGVGWYSDDFESVPLYRQYNPWAKAGSHNYTTSLEENDNLVSAGWIPEGIGWYGVLVNDEGQVWVPEQGHMEPVFEDIWFEDWEVIPEHIEEVPVWVFSDEARLYSEEDAQSYAEENPDLTFELTAEEVVVPESRVDNGRYITVQTGVVWVIDAEGH